MAEMSAPTVDDRLGTPSMTTLTDTPTWRSANSPYSWRYYLQGTAEPGGAGVPVYAAPARATVQDLTGLPPAFLTAYQIPDGPMWDMGGTCAAGRQWTRERG